jgi:hypothetical protein
MHGALSTISRLTAPSRQPNSMPLVHALLADASDTQPGKTISNPAPLPLPTHKRRNELLAEEI